MLLYSVASLPFFHFFFTFLWTNWSAGETLCLSTNQSSVWSTLPSLPSLITACRWPHFRFGWVAQSSAHLGFSFLSVLLWNATDNWLSVIMQQNFDSFALCQVFLFMFVLLKGNPRSVCHTSKWLLLFYVIFPIVLLLYYLMDGRTSFCCFRMTNKPLLITPRLEIVQVDKLDDADELMSTIKQNDSVALVIMPEKRPGVSFTPIIRWIIEITSTSTVPQSVLSRLHSVLSHLFIARIAIVCAMPLLR